VTVREMVEEAGVSEKTIRRDLQTFQRVGFPLVQTVCDHGRKRWHIDRTSGEPPLTFAFDEAIALYVARHLMEPLAGTVFWDAAQRAFRKIRATLGSSALEYIHKFRQVFHQTTFGAGNYAGKGDLIDQITLGIEDRRAVFITYQSLRATEAVTYDIFPYGFTYHLGSLYLIGRKREDDSIRHWKVDRIEDAEVTKFPFPMPEDFDLREHLAKSFGIYQTSGDVHVKVRFSATVARHVEESRWHQSQKLTREKDGSLIAAFDLDTIEEIKQWVLSFGQNAEVLEPEELRNAIIEEVESLRRQYAKRKPSPTRMAER
jgi:proteasome accessory factor B